MSRSSICRNFAELWGDYSASMSDRGVQHVAGEQMNANWLRNSNKTSFVWRNIKMFSQWWLKDSMSRTVFISIFDMQQHFRETLDNKNKQSSYKNKNKKTAQRDISISGCQQTLQLLHLIEFFCSLYSTTDTDSIFNSSCFIFMCFHLLGDKKAMKRKHYFLGGK